MSIVETVGEAAAPPGWLKPAVYTLSAGGLGLGVLAGLTGDPISTALLLAAPVATLGLAASAPALFEVRRRGGGRGFNVGTGGGVFGVFFAAAIGPAVLGWQTQAIVGLVGALVGLGAALATAPRASLAGPIQYAALLAVFGAVYGAGALRLADARFDSGPARQFQTTVLDKYTSSGRSGVHYHLWLAAWGPVARASEAEVGRGMYDQVDRGETVCPALHPGALGLPWYVVALCPAAPGSPA